MESKLGGIGEGAERSLGTRWDGPAHQRFGYAILSHVLHILTHYEYCGYAYSRCPSIAHTSSIAHTIDIQPKKQYSYCT